MAGISQYFHGEEGTAVEITWVAGGTRLFYVMKLEGNPHRTFTQDYIDHDIGIDPLIRPGDDVVYIRLSDYHGIWVEKGNDSQAQLEQAEKRVMRFQKIMEEYGELAESELLLPEDWVISLFLRLKAIQHGWIAQKQKDWLNSLASKTHTPARLRKAEEILGVDYLESSSKEPSLFISYSNRNVLRAQELFRWLEREAMAKVWFDQAQPGEAPTHEKAVEDWLQQGIKASQVFVLLLTEDSVASAWVKKEIAWAVQKAENEADFHFVVLNLDGVEVPQSLSSKKYMIDTQGLSLGQVLEELYAAVYKRQGREEFFNRPGMQKRDTREDHIDAYERWQSTSGTALGLRWVKRGADIYWALDWLATGDGQERHAVGHGESEVVDPGIRMLDRIGFFHFDPDVSVWMRSDKIDLTPNEVIASYLKKIGHRPLAKPTSPQAVPAPSRGAGIQQLLLLVVYGLLVIGLCESLVWFVYVKDYISPDLPAWLNPSQYQAGRVVISTLSAVVALFSGLYHLRTVSRLFPLRNSAFVWTPEAFNRATRFFLEGTSYASTSVLVFTVLWLILHGAFLFAAAFLSLPAFIYWVAFSSLGGWFLWDYFRRFLRPYDDPEGWFYWAVIR